jgi:hypothetical protein
MESVPRGHEWHRELLRQMGTDIPQVRPAVLSAQTVQDLEEYLGFRHVVRHIYAFEFDFERVERLVRHLRPLFERVSTELESICQSSRASQLIDRWKIVAGAQHTAAFLSQRHTSPWYRSLGAGTSQT